MAAISRIMQEISLVWPIQPIKMIEACRSTMKAIMITPVFIIKSKKVLHNFMFKDYLNILKFVRLKLTSFAGNPSIVGLVFILELTASSFMDKNYNKHNSSLV